MSDGVCVSILSFFILCSCNAEKQAVVDKSKQSASIQQEAAQPHEPDSDRSEVMVSESAPVSETMGAPIPIKAGFKLENTDGKDIIRIIAAGIGSNADKLTFQYEWTKNNEPAGNGDSISGFKRGDKIAVKVTPFDGKNYGQPRILIAEIKKTTPRLTESSRISFDGKVLLYQVKAVSPDGDPITYSLMDAPQGMDIDKNTGLIKWVVPENAPGNQSVKVKMSDNAGGELIYTLNIGIR